ncbi:MAG: hypothetical protein Cons2KO_33580 [Congregibacter sp.]
METILGVSSSASLMDGLELQYTYEDGGEVVLGFHDGCVRFEFLNGPLAGTKHADLPYLARSLDEDVYFVRWHNKDAGSYVTLYIDLPGDRLFGSALIWYSSDEPVDLFDAAFISRVSREDAA